MSCIPKNAKIKTTETVLEEAERIVNGPRRRDYDHPRVNFAKIGQVWSALVDVDITPRQVALMLIGMKCVRDSHNPKRDNIVDIPGYARCIELAEELPLLDDDMDAAREVLFNKMRGVNQAYSAPDWADLMRNGEAEGEGK